MSHEQALQSIEVGISMARDAYTDGLRSHWYWRDGYWQYDSQQCDCGRNDR